MDTPAGTAPPHASLRRLAASLLGLARTRAQLAVVELREEGARRKHQLAMALAAAVFFALALLCGSLLVVVAFWDTHRIAALGVVTLAHAGMGTWALVALRRLSDDAPQPFAATLAELERDREVLMGGADGE